MALEQARQHKQMLDESVAVTCFFRAMELLEGEPESPEHSQAMWSLSFTQMADGRCRGGAGVARGGAGDRSPGGQPGPGGDGGAGVGAPRGHRGGPERGAPAPRRGGRAGHAARRRADPRRLRVLRGDLDLSGALRLGAGDGVDEHVDPLLRARVDRRVHRAVPLPPGGDRPAARAAGPGRGAGAAGVRGAAGGQPLQRRPGATASWWTSGSVAATWPAPRRRSRRPWRSVTTASRGGVACCWPRATRRPRCGASPGALADQGFLARERRVFVLPVHVTACLAVGDEPGGQRERRRARGAGSTVRHARTGRGGRGGAWRAGAPPRRHRGGDRLAAGRASAPGARSTPPTKPPRRACGSPGPWRPTATTPAPASSSRPPLARRRRSAPPSTSTSLPPRSEPAAASPAHLPLLRHRGVDPAGRGDG